MQKAVKAFGVYVLVCAVQIGCMPADAPSAGGPPPGGPPSGLAAPPLPSGPGGPETEALLKRLVGLADSRTAADQGTLAQQLAQAATIDRLDTPQERNQRTPQDLRIARVFDHLRANHSPATAQTLAALARSEAINADWRVQELLVRAFEIQRPLLPESVAYLDAQSQPKSLNLQVVIIVLVQNGSEPALALLGRKLADPNLDEQNKLSWIRYQLLPRRRSESLLLGIEKWLSSGKLSSSVRTGLVEALFDYRPGEWGGVDLPKPPDERATTPASAQVLRRIGTAVLGGDYPASVKNAARQTLGNLP